VVGGGGSRASAVSMTVVGGSDGRPRKIATECRAGGADAMATAPAEAQWGYGGLEGTRWPAVWLFSAAVGKHEPVGVCSGRVADRCRNWGNLEF
jgi:hypothetical protein